MKISIKIEDNEHIVQHQENISEEKIKNYKLGLSNLLIYTITEISSKIIEKYLSLNLKEQETEAN